VPNWKVVLDEVKASGSTHDVVRRKYLTQLHQVTRRNVIVYYSGWLQKGKLVEQGANFGLNDGDKTGFMATIHELDRSLGLDLVLHTPGGEIAAVESLVDYLRSMFPSNIRVIIPEIAMSGGTMIACAANEIVMGRHSSLGPIDPQYGGLPAHAVIEEFERAAREIKADQSRVWIWQPILAKYNPTVIGECQKAIEWSEEMVRQWLMSGMFASDPDSAAKADKVIAELADHALTKSHARHVSFDRAKNIGLKVASLEANDDLQDAVLTVHHACIQTLTETQAYKIIENHRGIAFIQGMQTIIVRG
jgi:ClpP class serine protease